MSKSDRLLDGLNEIGDDLIRDAEDNVPVVLKKRKNSWVKWVALAASILLISLAVPVGLLTFGGTSRQAVNSADEPKQGAPDDKLDPVLTTEPLPEATSPVDVPHSSAPKGAAPYDGSFPDLEVSESDGRAPGPVSTPGEEFSGEDETMTAQPVKSGQLTAAAWDDNQHYLKWKELFEKNEQNTVSGKFADGVFAFSRWGLKTLKRIEVIVLAGNAPIADAEVLLDGSAGVITKARTNANGIAYLFADPAGTLTVHCGAFQKTAALNGETEVQITFEPEQLAADSTAHLKTIELMYVIDVTGSMGDELVYIQKELENVLEEVVKANPGTRVRLALLFYRDHGDEEVFRYVEFKDVTDPAGYEEQKVVLLKEEAAGGGDMPEAVDEALEIAVGKDWSDGATKLIFHVMDAPAHEEDAVMTRFRMAVQKAAEKGIRICPVMASGADQLAEYLCRSEAIMTGGTFVFLTDDSGIGGAHYDPELPKAVREHLNKLMIRLINGYHTGVFAEPVPWDAE